MNKSKIDHQLAFTLLELLVTILFIGVLSVFALAGFQTIQKRALRMQCASNLRQIGLAIQQYAGENDNSLPGPAWVSLPFNVQMFGSMQGYNQMGVFLARYLMERSIKLTDPPPSDVMPLYHPCINSSVTRQGILYRLIITCEHPIPKGPLATKAEAPHILH